jgi:hypothetical protein
MGTSHAAKVLQPAPDERAFSWTAGGRPAEKLVERGATETYAAAAHGAFAGEWTARIEVLLDYATNGDNA